MDRQRRDDVGEPARRRLAESQAGPLLAVLIAVVLSSIVLVAVVFRNHFTAPFING